MTRHARTVLPVLPAALRFVDSEFVAERYGIHIDTVRRYARTGVIPSYRLGQYYRFDLDAVDRVLGVAPADEDVG